MKKLKPTKTNRKKLDAQISKIVTKMIKENKYEMATFDKNINRYTVTYLLDDDLEKKLSKLSNKEKGKELRKELIKKITKNLNIRGTKLSKKSLRKKLIELRSKTTITEEMSFGNYKIKKRGLTESQINAVRDQSLPKLINIQNIVTELKENAKSLILKESTGLLSKSLEDAKTHIDNAVKDLKYIKENAKDVSEETIYGEFSKKVIDYWQEKEQFELSLKNARAVMYGIDRSILNASELLLVSTLTDKISDILQDYQSITYERRKYKDSRKNDQILVS